MSTAMIQPEIGAQPEPMLEAVHDPGQIFKFAGEVTIGRSPVSWQAAVPENRIYDGWGMIVPGFSGVGCSSEAPGTGHVNEGMPTVVFNPARKSQKSFMEDLADGQAIHVATIKAVFAAVKEIEPTIKRTIPDSNNLDSGRQVLVPHSMGGLAATRYALGETGSTEAILHKASCGFGHPTLAELAMDVPKGALAGLIYELVPSLSRGDIKLTMANARQFIEYFRHLQVLAEAVSCLTDNSRGGTQQLMEAGVYVDYEAYQHDVLVRPDPGIAQFVHGHRIMPRAGHLAPIRKARHVARGSAKTIASL